jgi:hypothetical protein
VTLEDDEPDTSEPKAAGVAVSVDVGADLPLELSTGPWWDIEDECYVYNDGRPILPPEEEGLPSTSTPTQAQPNSYRHPSQDRLNRQNNNDGVGRARTPHSTSAAERGRWRVER